MDLRKSRKIICVLLTFIMAVGALISVGTAVFKYTVCRNAYMEMFLLSDNMIQQCDDSYNSALEALEEETGIPAEVYQTANDKFILTETAVSRMFSNQNASMYSNDKIEIYEKLCREYLDGNKISYDSTAIHNAAEKAAEIYSDCYGISNSESLYLFINNVQQHGTGVIALGMLFIMLPIAAILILFKKKERLLTQFFASVSCSGFSLVLFGIVGLVAGIGKGIMITPGIYAKAFENAIMLDFVFIIIVGAVVSALAVYGAVKTNDKITEKRIMDEN